MYKKWFRKHPSKYIWWPQLCRWGPQLCRWWPQLCTCLIKSILLQVLTYSSLEDYRNALIISILSFLMYKKWFQPEWCTLKMVHYNSYTRFKSLLCKRILYDGMKLEFWFFTHVLIKAWSCALARSHLSRLRIYYNEALSKMAKTSYSVLDWPDQKWTKQCLYLTEGMLH